MLIVSTSGCSLLLKKGSRCCSLTNICWLMIACDRMISIREKEAHLQLQRQELADKEFIFESERSASVLMRHKSCAHSVVFAKFSEILVGIYQRRPWWVKHTIYRFLPRSNVIPEVDCCIVAFSSEWPPFKSDQGRESGCNCYGLEFRIRLTML